MRFDFGGEAYFKGGDTSRSNGENKTVKPWLTSTLQCLISCSKIIIIIYNNNNNNNNNNKNLSSLYVSLIKHCKVGSSYFHFLLRGASRNFIVLKLCYVVSMRVIIQSQLSVNDGFKSVRRGCQI